MGKSGKKKNSGWFSAVSLSMEFLKIHSGFYAIALVAIEAILVACIITYVRYTKIDWDAYMSQVTGFLDGERDYRNLKGDTGPLVYPAGFLYIYAIIQYFTGGDVYPAQILFAVLYAFNLCIVLFIYWKTDKLPWWALTFICLSKRIHSIFVLRLFNDCFAMTFLHAALAMFICEKWHLGMILFSGAVSVKMNVLLYAPSLLLLLLKAMSITRVMSVLVVAALVQIALGLPFLLSYPFAYIANAFNLGRVFIHFWSVNFKFVPEEVFVSKQFAASLLAVHLAMLAAFAHYKWCKYEGGVFGFLKSIIQKQFYNSQPRNPTFKSLSSDHIVTTMFTGNFIGIICARSLHYQFYSWYFFSMPYLLWKTCYPTWLRIILFFGVEICWNIYPSTGYSSALLMCLHLLLLWGVWSSPSEYPYTGEKTKHN